MLVLSATVALAPGGLSGCSGRKSWCRFRCSWRNPMMAQRDEPLEAHYPFSTVRNAPANFRLLRCFIRLAGMAAGQSRPAVVVTRWICPSLSLNYYVLVIIQLLCN